MSGKLSLRRILNTCRNEFKYRIRKREASASPSLLIVEPTNACNMSCTTCRSEKGGIYDHYYLEKPGEIKQGFIDTKIFDLAINEFKNEILMCVLYLEGEPLLHNKISTMIGKCSVNGISTLIATNGMLLNRELMISIIESGLDIIKIAVSGFTQEVYGQFHRKGDVEKIKRNLIEFSKLKEQYRSSITILVDYFCFEYNQSEIQNFKNFCKEYNLKFSKRKGDPPVFGPHGNIEVEIYPASKKLCSWPWHVSVLNWDGSIIPCNQFSKSSYDFKLGTLGVGPNFREIWNGLAYRNFREHHLNDGREGLFLCDRCDISGIGFRPKEN